MDDIKLFKEFINESDKF